MLSAAEAEIAGVFKKLKNAKMIRQIIMELGHPHSPTPIQTDNTMARNIIINTAKQRKTRVMDVRFYWLQDRALQHKYHFIGKAGKWIKVTSTPNIIQPATIEKNAPPSSMPSIWPKILFGKDVLEWVSTHLQST